MYRQEVLPKTGKFVISLDFELGWGVFEKKDFEKYKKDISGARLAIPQILDIFRNNGIRATWATVGFLFCRNKDHLLSVLPDDNERPAYSEKCLSAYNLISAIGENEAEDPIFYGLSLIRQIADTPNQEIGTHTLSHYYCLEDGQTISQFENDLDVALKLASEEGVALRSIVFPRNQFDKNYLSSCEKKGIVIYRGNPSAWVHAACKQSEITRTKRAVRLFDSAFGIYGDNTSTPVLSESQVNVPASRFLYPQKRSYNPISTLQVRVIKKGMLAAAKHGRVFHLWWHPHNFGGNVEGNLAILKDLIGYYQKLSDTYGFESHSMESLFDSYQ